jgi:Na+/proline symporter
LSSSPVPVGVVIYVWIGGLRASLLADYIHTSALFSIIIAFMLVTFATSDKIGSPGKMYELLQEAGRLRPVVGNHEGSYLTFRSQGALIFGIINVVSTFFSSFDDVQ